MGMGRHPFDHFPYHHHWYLHHRRFGFFRRFFWFSFGAFTAIAVARHNGYVRFAVEDGPDGQRQHWHGWRHEHRWDGGWDGPWGCRRVGYKPHLEQGGAPPMQQGGSQPTQPTPDAQEKMLPTTVPVQAVTGQTTPPPSPRPGKVVPPVEQRWETEVRELGRNATERMTDLSESTIDSMLATLIGLKTRLAEHRSQQQQGTPPPPPPSQQQPNQQSPNDRLV